MSIDIILRAVRAYARAAKSVASPETRPFLLAIRGQRPVAVLTCGELRSLLRVADDVAAGYGVDALAVAFKGVFPTVEINPLTGDPWEFGEEDQIWLERDGVERGWASVAQLTAVALRTGETSETTWPFSATGGSVLWSEVPVHLPQCGLADMLSTMFDLRAPDPARVPDPGDRLFADPENGPFYDPWYGRILLDIDCTRTLAGELLGRGDAFLLVDSELEAEYLIYKGLPRWQVEVASG